MSVILLPKSIDNMNSIECFETAIKYSGIMTIDDVDDESKLSKVDKSLFAASLVKTMENAERHYYEDDGIGDTPQMREVVIPL